MFQIETERGVQMSIFDRFRKGYRNSVNLEDQSVQLDDVLLSALLNGEKITREKALTLPAVSSDVDFIASSIASMPVLLYKYESGKVDMVVGLINAVYLVQQENLYGNNFVVQF